MKEAIRHGLFETNSSSVHSLVYVVNDDAPQPIPKFDSEYGKLVHIIHGGSYQCSGCLVTSEEKLNYLIGWLFVKKGYDLGDFLEDDDYKNIEKWVCERTGADGFKTKLVHEHSDEYEKMSEREQQRYGISFDHQSNPFIHDEDFLVDYRDKHEVLKFIFDENVAVEMSFD